MKTGPTNNNAQRSFTRCQEKYHNRNITDFQKLQSLPNNYQHSRWILSVVLIFSIST